VEAGRPGQAGQNGRVVVPIFPLPNVYLFPGCVMPLHIFEPRYRQMIEDLLDRPGRLVMGTIQEGQTDFASKPAMCPVAGLGEIGRHERLPDGRFLIWLVGISRVRIREVDSDRLYRKVEIQPLEEIDVPRDDAHECRARVQAALLARCPEFLNLPANIPLTHLVDLLLQRLRLPPSCMQDLYVERDLRKRADGALAEHARRPLDPLTEEPPTQEPPASDPGGSSRN